MHFSSFSSFVFLVPFLQKQIGLFWLIIVSHMPLGLGSNFPHFYPNFPSLQLHCRVGRSMLPGDIGAVADAVPGASPRTDELEILPVMEVLSARLKGRELCIEKLQVRASVCGQSGVSVYPQAPLSPNAYPSASIDMFTGMHQKTAKSAKI